ncbi:hypothetical protein [Nocardia sp. NPDC050435]|uniref:hypothetical protein n=1 Tax=Nocardia sp. NPDC050435 TaxID=3155040 RepID=UPI0034014E7F
MTSTTRVAVRAVTSGVVGLNSAHTEAWKIVPIPTDCLGDFDAEAHEIIGIQGIGFVGAVIVVDDGVAGFAAGCSTWSGYWDDDLDLPSERDHAALEHRDCEHTLFGTTPTEGWTRETDPGVLRGLGAVAAWSLRTGPCAPGEYCGLVAQNAGVPTGFVFSVYADELGPLCERLPAASRSAAMTAAVVLLVGAISQR